MPVEILTTKYELVDPKTLKRFKNNPRIGNADELAESFEINGFWGSLIVQETSREVLAGNHRLDGAILAEMPEVPVSWVNVPRARQIKINLADNRYAEKGHYDRNLQLEQLDKLDDYEGTGFQEDDVEDLRKLLNDDDEMPTVTDDDIMGMEPDNARYTEQHAVMVICNDGDHQEEVFERLREEGYMVRVVST